ncbi:hypothetical protein U9M48_001094 [Paspalum notatum var. saurae]|uniref:DUF4220 domain-containing protein n=1 Tax=Paspalum notatum var. saurae TaxID=547442 RepID=A0AAQ3PEI8_PASNO
MEPRSPTPRGGICSNAALQEELRCPGDAVAAFYGTMGRQIWLGNALLLASAAMTGVMVGIGSYGRRYRHHRFTRFVFLGANTLFLPVVSFVVSTLRDSSNDYVNRSADDGGTSLVALCHSVFHPCMVITWAFLVQMAALSTVSVVAIDGREGRRVGPPWELLVKGVWTFYLAASITNSRFFHGLFRISPSGNHGGTVTLICSKIMFAPFALICAKIWLKWYSYRKARKSFALGRNPGLVFGYMQQQQLQQAARSQRHGGPAMVGEQEHHDTLCPPLLVVGEDSRQVERRPWGYVFSDVWTTDTDSSIGLVTLDRIWRLDGTLPASTPRLKDLCLSFAMFKLLRCRFARYDHLPTNNLRLVKFFWGSLLLKDGDHERVLRVIADELSFVHDCYYSSLPISYAKWWLPLLSIFLSLLSIGYCVVAAYFTVVFAAHHARKKGRSQIICDFWCSRLQEVTSQSWRKEFGNLYFDVLPEFVLLLLVMVAEVRDVSSCICSNWTKVALICRVNCASSSSSSLQRQHGVAHRLVGHFLQWRCRMMNHWDEKIGQCSVLVPHPTPKTTLVGVVSRLFHLPDEKRKVKVPDAVKVCIMDALRSAASSSSGCQCQLGNGRTSLQRSHAGKSFLWACNAGRSTSEIILTWHVATCILEFRRPAAHRHDHTGQASALTPISTPNQHKIAATHLSKYCAYLMSWCPELLPEEEAWSKSLYEAVKADAERVLAGGILMAGPPMPETEYQELVRLLSAGSNHLVLKNGARLGKQLVELVEGEETAWAILAGFWAEMILSVAPSSNLKAHKRAIARGGELITLLWALLFHAGIVSRPGDEADGGAATAVGATV